MRRGSMLVIVLTMVMSLLALAPVGAVTEPDSDFSGFEAADVVVEDTNPFKKQGNGVWVIHLEDAPVATYEGGTDGLAGTSNSVTGADKLDTDTPEARAYRAHLESVQSAFVSDLEAELGRAVSLRFQYFNAANALALSMTWQEASRTARMDGVSQVLKDTRHTIDTDNGPAWIGAPSAWDGSATGLATKGEGIVVGVLDSGINPSNPSFAAVGPIDGYVHTNPLGDGVYLGECASDPAWGCTAKLIGAYALAGPTAIDDDGHGSHTASTAAGNEVLASVVGPTITEDRTISGVAPHANIIAYDVCDGEGCDGTAILAGIDQAIADGVDVINYSIGSTSPSDPWTSSDDLGFLAARDAGIFVAHSAGNEGPGAATVGSPMAPWMTHVAATTHDRAYLNGLVDMSGGDTPPPADMTGLGFTAGFGPAEIVYAGDFPSAETADPNLCGVGSLGDFDSPWPAGTFTSDQIVVCDRGTFGRVEKGANVLAAGAGGYVLADNGGGLSGDAHELPGVHISQSDGEILKAWLASGTGHTATIAGATLSVDDANGDVMAGFSSRGPNRSANTIAPSVGAPGVDIIAAHGQGDPAGGEWQFVSGTSMASPHVAGVAALMKVLHPDWTPAMVESALVMTGVRDVLKEDGATPADPFDFGGGRVDVVAAANAGLVLDETTSNYADANPASGGDPTTLNMASMNESACVVECSWTRTFTSTASGSVTWDITTTESGGVVMSASPSNFTIAPGATQEVTFTANVEGAASNVYHFGYFELAPSTAIPALHLPMAVQPTTGSIPSLISITTGRSSGSWDVDGLEALEITDLRVDVTGLAKAWQTDHSLVEDPTSDDPYDDLDQVLVRLADVPADTHALIAEITASEAPDLDLYVGFDANNDGIATPDEQVCFSASGTAFEKCAIDAPAEGQWWILVQNWASPPTGLEHAFTLATTIVPNTDLGNMSVIGPDTVPQLDPFSISVLWDLPEAEAGDVYHGSVALGTTASKPGNIGTIPIVVERVADDVSKSADVASAAPGDTIEYTITVNPNVTNQDLAYTITDTIPEGLTYVEGSATGGATVTDGVVEWNGVMESPALAELFYEASTPATNPYCDTGFGGYVDLESFGLLADPGIDGDTTLWTAFAGQDPIHFYGDYHDSVSFSDDGIVIFDPASNWGGQPWVPQVMPDPALPSNLLAPMWNDFQVFYDEATNSGVTLATAGTTVSVIEYDDIQFFGGSDAQLDFQVVLYANPDPLFPEIVFAYDNVIAGGVPAAIGVENAAGDGGLTLAYGDTTALVSNGSQICLDWVGPEFDPVVITYQVTVDEDAPHGLVENTAVSITDNFGDAEESATATVDIDNPGYIDGTPYATLDTVAAELAELLSDSEGNSKSDIRRLTWALDRTNRAMRPHYWADEMRLTSSGRAVFYYTKSMVWHVSRISDGATFHDDATALAKSTTGAMEKVTELAIDESNAPDNLIRRATWWEAKGDERAEAGNYHGAINAYRYAWIVLQYSGCRWAR